MTPFARLTVGIATILLFIGSAQAQEGPYYRFGLGAGIADDGFISNSDFDPGITATAAIGYSRFTPRAVADPRIELELSYRYNATDSLGAQSLDGDAHTFGAMVNGFLDIRTNLPVVPFIGAGYGYAHVRYDDDGAGVAPPIDDDDTVFAYQLMTGLTYELGGDRSIGFEYRYFDAESLRFTNSGGANVSADYRQHSFMAVLTMRF